MKRLNGALSSPWIGQAAQEENCAAVVIADQQQEGVIGAELHRYSGRFARHDAGCGGGFGTLFVHVETAGYFRGRQRL